MQLRCAVGIGRSKMIAKLASRAAKPRATRQGLEPGPGVYLVGPEDERAFLHAHDVEALWGVGPATAKRLHDLGVRTVGELAALPPDTLVRRLGKASGAHLAALARGDDPEPVRPNRPTKSIGHEETFSQDLVDPTELERHVLRMAESVATMLRGESSSCRTVTVKVKFRDFSLQTRSHTLDRPITTGSAIGQVAAALLAGIDPGEGIRLLGVSASGLQEGGSDQLAFDLGDGMDQATDSAVAREQSWQDVTATVDAIRTRFGQEFGGVGRPRHERRGGGAGAARRAVGSRRVAARRGGVAAPGRQRASAAWTATAWSRSGTGSVARNGLGRRFSRTSTVDDPRLPTADRTGARGSVSPRLGHRTLRAPGPEPRATSARVVCRRHRSSPSRR